MTFALGNLACTIIKYSVHKPIGIVDSTTPEACQILFQWFRFTYPPKRGTLNILEQSIYAFQCLLVLTLPVEVFFPSTVMLDQHVSQPQSARVTSNCDHC